MKEGVLLFIHALWTFFAGACKGILWFVVAFIVIVISLIIAIPLWFYQLLKVLNCDQRVAAGFGGALGTIMGYTVHSPHIGFMVGAVSGWFGWYVMNRLPGMSVIEQIWNKFSSRTINWTTEIIRAYLPPDSLPISI